jgi:hypothetical protein
MVQLFCDVHLHSLCDLGIQMKFAVRKPSANAPIVEYCESDTRFRASNDRASTSGACVHGGDAQSCDAAHRDLADMGEGPARPCHETPCAKVAKSQHRTDFEKYIVCEVQHGDVTVADDTLPFLHRPRFFRHELPIYGYSVKYDNAFLNRHHTAT